MSDTLNLVPLNELVVADTNVRTKAYDEAGVRRLADQIAAKGRVIDPLKGARRSKKRVGIHDGGRRLAALNMLKTEGRLPEALSKGIPVIFDEDDRVAQIETSIMSNERENFSPIEECRAFSTLAAEGMDITSIANRFGISERLVNQRLALANVHPTIIDAFENNSIDLSKLQAYTIESDQDVQLRVFNSVQSWTSAREIRRTLTETEIPVTSGLVQFITLESYIHAGGTVREDLFDDDASVCCDPDLVRSLAASRLEQKAAEVAESGWKWVETHLESDYEYFNSFANVFQEPPTLTDEQAAEVERLNVERTALFSAQEALYSEFGDIETLDEAQAAKLDECETALNDIEAQLDALEGPAYSDAQKSIAGAIVYLRNGKCEIRDGLVRSEDQAATDSFSDGVDDGSNVDPIDKSVVIGKGLSEDINLAVQVGLQRRIAEDHKTAFLVSTAWLASCVFGESVRDSSLVYPPSQHFRHSVGVPLASDDAFEIVRASWGEKLNGEGDLVSRLSEWPPAEVKALHSFCASVLYTRQELAISGRVSGSHERLRQLLAFKPESEVRLSADVLGRFSRAQLLKVLHHVAADKDILANAKKGELVALADKHVGDWLPAQFHDDTAYAQLLPVVTDN